jgi:hypothetical protein
LAIDSNTGRARDDEVEDSRISCVPGSVLWTRELGDAETHAERLQLRAVPDIRGICNLLEHEGAIDGAVVLYSHRAARIVIAVGDLDPVEFSASEPGAFDRMACPPLIAHVHINLTRRAVVESDDDRLVTAVRMGDAVFP